jgi:predicted PurR-regulated permease PerM
MTLTVTIEGIVLLLLGVIGLVVGIYLLVVLKNANNLVNSVSETLAENQEKIDRLITHLEEVSGNTAHFSGQLKRQFEKNELVVSSIFQTGADSLLLVNDAAGRIRTLVGNVNEIIKILSRFLKK